MKISVIIPAYNAERYIQRCIDSLMRQSYDNLEVIVINDGSTDNTKEIVKQVVLKNKRVRLINKTNGGPNSARRVGLDNAKGEYVIFIDADDYVDERICERLLSDIEENHTQAAMCSMKKIYSDSSEEYCYEKYTGVYEGKYLAENILCEFYKKNIQPRLCAILCEKEIMRYIFSCIDDRVRFLEDYVCFYFLLLYVKKIYVDNEFLYNYVMNNTSLMHTHKNKIDSISYAYRILKKELEKEDVSTVIKREMIWTIFFGILIGGYEALSNKSFLFPFKDVKLGSKVIVYGAGIFGAEIVNYIKEENKYYLSLWVDQAYERYQEEGFTIQAPREILSCSYDFIVIAIVNPDIAKEAKMNLESLGIPSEKIIMISSELIVESELPEEFNII